MALTGLLLAGGHSTRMGADKAFLEFEGEPLARRVASALDSVCDEVLVASGDGRRLDWLKLEQVPDVLQDAGPLAGMVAGLERARYPLVAVAAVDMPYASPAVFALLARLHEGQDAVVPETAEGLQPLHAVYARTAATGLRDALEQGERSVRRALEALEVRVVPPAEWQAADPTGSFARNINRPEDLPSPLPRGNPPRE
jgi:molybdopterin-guanine dinucleotide biosynthesis protein A